MSLAYRQLSHFAFNRHMQKSSYICTCTNGLMFISLIFLLSFVEYISHVRIFSAYRNSFRIYPLKVSGTMVIRYVNFVVFRPRQGRAFLSTYRVFNSYGSTKIRNMSSINSIIQYLAVILINRIYGTQSCYVHRIIVRINKTMLKLDYFYAKINGKMLSWNLNN